MIAHADLGQLGDETTPCCSSRFLTTTSVDGVVKLIIAEAGCDS